MSTSDQVVKLIEVVVPLLYGFTGLLFVWEILASYLGWSRAGWGFVGFLFLANAIGSASLCAIALRMPDTSTVPGEAAELDIIGLVASIALGGLGSNLLAHWLTSLTTSTTRRRHSPPRPGNSR